MSSVGANKFSGTFFIIKKFVLCFWMRHDTIEKWGSMRKKGGSFVNVVYPENVIDC